MLRIFLIPLLVILAGIPSSASEGRLVLRPDGRMEATPVPLDPENPSMRRVGALTYLGGVRLTSRDRAFGGFSAMHVEGDAFTLLSDGGNIVRFRMGSDFRPRDVKFADLASGPGIGWFKWERDAESMTRDPATGRWWVGYESRTGIMRYDPALSQWTGWRQPRPMRDWDDNGGPESLVRLANGSFVVISESTHPENDQRLRMAMRFAGDPNERRTGSFGFRYMPPEGYDPSDMAQLPDGRLIVLNRRFRPGDWFSAKLTLVDPKYIRPMAVIRGREIATIGAPLTRDNFEAVAAVREGEATIVWLATDDNRSWFERSLLMKFRLEAD